MNKILKYLFLLTLLAAVLISIALVINTISYGLNLFGLSKAMSSIINRQQLTLKNSSQFDKTKVLKNLKPNPLNSFYYLFDEHLSDAKLAIPKSRINTRGDSSYLINFDADKKLFDGKLRKVYISANKLKDLVESDKYINIKKDLNIPFKNIKNIEIKLKTNNNNKMTLYMTDKAEFDFKKIAMDPKIATILNLDIIPDGNYHTYIIDSLLFKESEMTVNNICLYFRSEDKIEIKYINFISSNNKYSKALYGDTYEAKDGIIKKAMYFLTPAKAKYTLKIPKGRMFFKSSIGVLKNTNPVKFNVTFKNGGNNQVIYTKTINNSSNWFDFKIDVSKWSDTLVEITFETISSGGNIAFWGNPVIYEPPKDRVNVIIWLEDALRADNMSCYDYKRNTTPAKTFLLKDGILFLNAISQTTDTATSCSSFMTSLYASSNGVWRVFDILDDKFLRLPEIMRNQGFETAAFSENTFSTHATNLHPGYSFTADKISKGPMNPGILFEWLDNNTDRNLFLYVHKIKPHGPYQAPKPFDAWYLNNKDTKISIAEKRDPEFDPPYISSPTLQGRRDLYDGSVRHNDFIFNKLVNKLKKLGMYDTTVIIHIADHGEFLGEHTFWLHQPPSYRQVIKVPFLIYYPDKLPKNLKIKQPVQLLDITPTVLDLVKIDKSSFLLQGDSLLPLIFGKDMPYWNNRALISEEMTNKEYSSPLKDNDASLIHKNMHILYSKSVEGDFISYLSKKTKTNYYLLRFFNLNTDKTEEGYFNNYLPNLFLYKKVTEFLHEFQANNVKIFKNIVKTGMSENKLTQEKIKTMKTLGYLQ
ncbi:MAG: sulfatase [Elusimicrobia bacterium]|nr:sulfatase [Candidatus Liberimonas magnetica]